MTGQHGACLDSTNLIRVVREARVDGMFNLGAQSLQDRPDLANLGVRRDGAPRLGRGTVVGVTAV